MKIFAYKGRECRFMECDSEGQADAVVFFLKQGGITARKETDAMPAQNNHFAKIFGSFFDGSGCGSL